MLKVVARQRFVTLASFFAHLILILDYIQIANSLFKWMNTMILSVVITREGKFYVALSPDIDVASQGETIENALSNLKEAIGLYFEDED